MCYSILSQNKIPEILSLNKNINIQNIVKNIHISNQIWCVKEILARVRNIILITNQTLKWNTLFINIFIQNYEY